jgi:hypothetical protein
MGDLLRNAVAMTSCLVYIRGTIRKRYKRGPQAMNNKQIIPSSHDLFRAEKQVFAGIFGRLYARYVLQYEPEYAWFLALAVARVLLSMSWENEQARVFGAESRPYQAGDSGAQG